VKWDESLSLAKMTTDFESTVCTEACNIVKGVKLSTARVLARDREDLAFRYLAGGTRPDFWALNEFRNRHGRAMNDVFTHVVELARSLAKLGHLRPHVPSDGRHHD